MSKLHYFTCATSSVWAIVCAKDKREARKLALPFMRDAAEEEEDIEVEIEIKRMPDRVGEPGVLSVVWNDYDD